MRVTTAEQNITFDVNNEGLMKLTQLEHDGTVKLTTVRRGSHNEQYIISPGDFVMLMNYYRQQKQSNKPIM